MSRQLKPKTAVFVSQNGVVWAFGNCRSQAGGKLFRPANQRLFAIGSRSGERRCAILLRKSSNARLTSPDVLDSVANESVISSPLGTFVISLPALAPPAIPLRKKGSFGRPKHHGDTHPYIFICRVINCFASVPSPFRPQRDGHSCAESVFQIDTAVPFRNPERCLDC